TKVIDAIGRRGHSVIVGRGANFILLPEKKFSVRTVAIFEKRKENVIREFDASPDQAVKRIRKREARRQDYIKKSFNADINDPVNYDLVINTGEMNLEDCVEAVKLFYFKKFSISNLINS
ncbi:MAG: cytidylate kinase family protein, partial [Deltaproteobacteria bacterium]|nr:cytidylate kinase family protein [Deltaproteobacteria bacterium]